ncbi:hypothetical protein TVAG_454870 [Trichomonas vaginalis G3]|uniref:Uncharacterized protein n=1 Tax=Trichomonas vaginalis (strain ATCC PRA-98 / G3) TaxID=412133 RepID=A2G676_TRIV3|nr:hypothetical protein TVAGG3_0626130 [Trichomonas vaginalis G3]EAX87343.1 hypothetical protein TVAG_454870 [Trichomonas vaginalis G3]KAI5504204.1 hypothetical protein TVAGG3_0626130 [Trichomonas vaginalis G3]|eukprot:XP_001300273.1 hypothetical protein [Trichomonas vaginalis G3]
MKENHKMSKKPYAEIVNFVDQDNSTQIQQLEKLYNYYSYMIDKLVDLPLQFVLFYCSSSNERLLSSKSLNISHNIRNRLKIYSIDNVSMRQLNLWKVFKDNQYLVNLAAWMTDCEYIFYSNLDFYPSFSFFYAIERKLLTPFSIFLFPSTTVSEIDQKQLKESKHIESSISFQNSTKIFTIENMVRTGLNGMFGSSKILLRAIDGFKDKFTFVMSIYSLKVPPIIKTFVGSQTLSTTYDIPLPYKSIEMQENLCKGAHFKKNNKTPHYLWGRSYEFIDSTRKSERYGHIAFNVIETTNNTNTIEIYTYFTDEI